MLETEGIFLAPEEQTPEQVKAKWSELVDSEKQEEYLAGAKQAEKFLMKAMTFVQKQNRN